MLIATVTPEVATDAVTALLDRHREDDLIVNDAMTVEIASACRHLESTGTGLHSGDALHLAAGEHAGAILVTIDRALARAAREAGLTFCDPRH